MAAGDVTLTNYGTYDISGATLKTVVDAVNLGATISSGASLYLLPTAQGRQVQVIKTAITGW